MTVPRAPISSSTTPTCSCFHHLLTSLLNSWYFLLFLILSLLRLIQLEQKYQLLSPCVLYCQLERCLVFLLPSNCHNGNEYPTTISLLHFLMFLLARIHTMSPSNPIYSFYKGPNELSLPHCHDAVYAPSEPVSRIKCPYVAHFYPICSHNQHNGLSLVLSMWYFT